MDLTASDQGQAWWLGSEHVFIVPTHVYRHELHSHLCMGVGVILDPAVYWCSCYSVFSQDSCICAWLYVAEFASGLESGVGTFPSLDSCEYNVLCSVLLALWDYSFIPTSTLLAPLTIYGLPVGLLPHYTFTLGHWIRDNPARSLRIWARQKSSTLCLGSSLSSRVFFLV